MVFSQIQRDTYSSSLAASKPGLPQAALRFRTGDAPAWQLPWAPARRKQSGNT
jgi:hypothetical protein